MNNQGFDTFCDQVVGTLDPFQRSGQLYLIAGLLVLYALAFVFAGMIYPRLLQERAKHIRRTGVGAAEEEATYLEHRSARYRLIFISSGTLAGLFALATIGFATFKYYQASKQYSESSTSSCYVSHLPGLTREINVRAEGPNHLVLGDRGSVDLLIRPQRGDCASTAAISYSAQILPKVFASDVTRVPVSFCETRWRWLIKPPDAGRQEITFAITARRKGDHVSFSMYAPKLVFYVDRDQPGAASWVPLVATLLGAIATLLAPIVSVMGRGRSKAPTAS
jgi:hypothetical protein